jgi:hypothetical protein
MATTGSRKQGRAPKPCPTSADLNSFREELAHAGDRAELDAQIRKLRDGLAALGLSDGQWDLIEIGRAAKKNFGERFSRAIAQKTADALRPDFAGIYPDERGRRHESKTKGAGGLKKLDVNYSTKRSGLELAISIKTINFRDEKSNRYTKNVKRVDGELRAEAGDCHKRQPWAVLGAYVFLPEDAASDGRPGDFNSSLRHAAKVLEVRAGRVSTKNEEDRFEIAFVGAYSDTGLVRFYAPAAVPVKGLPEESLSFAETLELVRTAYKTRNK